ncbi:MAG: hypothetical protein M3Y32_06465 [Pseudomonadota bacterium]|nr:hypothetical protein [Pseudomonadota bacterium]
MRRLSLLLLSLSCAATSGCAVVSVAGAVAGAAIDVGGAVIGTTVRVTGKVIEKTIDLVMPDSTAAAAK